jgi:hypothetical protein
LHTGQRLVVQLVVDAPVLQPAETLVAAGYFIERCQHRGLEFRLDGGERHGVFNVVARVVVTARTLVLSALTVI